MQLESKMRHYIIRFLQTIDRVASGKGFYYLAALIFVFEMINILNGNYGKDFWEHNAVVSELIENPFSPDHPIVPLDVPHAFFSPYTVMLGFIGYFTGIDAFTLMTLAGIMNLILLIIALRFFVFSIFSEHQNKIAFYLLLFQFLAWGPAAWQFSSFYHITTLHYVLPYPSTFAFIITLFAAGIYIRTYKRSMLKFRILLMPLIGLMNTAVLLIHPTTAIFLFGFIFVCFFVNLIRNISITDMLFFLAIVAIPLLLVAQWPYYPFWDLVLQQSQGSQFHTASKTLYFNLFVRLLPVWVILPMLWMRFRKDHTDFYVILFLGLLAVYLYGYITGQYGYGRVIFFMVLVLHLVAAEWFARLDIQSSAKVVHATVFYILILPFILFHSPHIIRNLIPGLLDKPYKNLEFLNETIGDDNIIMTDTETMLYVPSYKGKVVASLYPPYWIPDNEQRMQDVRLFFSSSTQNDIRIAILKRRNISNIILKNDPEKVPDSVRDFSLSVSSVMYSNQDYVLLEVDPERIN